MNQRVERRHRAKLDIIEHAVYISQDNIHVAAKFLDTVENEIEKLVDWPGMGIKCNGRIAGMSGLRRWVIPPYPNYIIYYRIFKGGIEIIRL